MKRKGAMLSAALMAALTTGIIPAFGDTIDRISVPFSSGRSAAEVTSDRDFVTKVQIDTQFEIDAAKIAVQQTTNPDIKKFAERMVQDHTKAGNELRSAIAADSDKYLPKDTPIDASIGDDLKRLQSLSGNQFDNTYVQMMIEAHQAAVSMFTIFEQTTKDPQLEAFGQKVLPVIESHLQDIETIRQKEMDQIRKQEKMGLN